MIPRFVEKPAFCVAGVTAVGRPGELNYTEIWSKTYMRLDPLLRPLSVEGGYYGATLSEDARSVYLAGVAVAEGAVLPEGAEVRTLPAARYAVFDCGLEAIGPTWRAAYERWLPCSGYVFDRAAVDFEFYPAVGADGVQKVEIYLPVTDTDPKNSKSPA